MIGDVRPEMNPILRTTILIFLIGLDLGLLVIAISPSHINSGSALHAFIKWRENPSQETEAVWTSEKDRLRQQYLIGDLILSLLVIATSTGIYYVWKQGKPEQWI